MRGLLRPHGSTCLLLTHWVGAAYVCGFHVPTCELRPLWPGSLGPALCSLLLCLFCIMPSALLQTCLFSSCFLLFFLHVTPVSWGCSAIPKLLPHPPPHLLCLWEAVSSAVKGTVFGVRLLGFEFSISVLPPLCTNVHDLGQIISSA